MKEIDIQSLIKRSFDAVPEAFYYKIPDLPKYGAMATRFSPPRPFDFVVWYRGTSFAFELKLHKGGNAFPFNKVSKFQIDSLINVAATGNCAGILICLWEPNTYRHLEYFPIEDWVALVEGAEEYGEPYRKSARPYDLMEEGFHVGEMVLHNKRGSETGWYFPGLLDFFVKK